MSRRPRRRRRRRPSPAEEPAAPAGREHRLPTLSARPRPHSGLGGRVPRRPPLPSPVRWAPGGPAPSGGGVLPQEPGRRPPLRGACVFPSSIPPPDRSPAAPEAGPRAVRGGDEATRLASGLEARGADVPQIGERPRGTKFLPQTHEGCQQTVFSSLLHPSDLRMENGSPRHDRPPVFWGGRNAHSRSSCWQKGSLATQTVARDSAVETPRIP